MCKTKTPLLDGVGADRRSGDQCRLEAAKVDYQ